MNAIDIPDDWSGEDALLVVAFLEEVIRAIWNHRQREMGLVLERQQTADDPVTSIDHFEDDEDVVFGDDILPF